MSKKTLEYLLARTVPAAIGPKDLVLLRQFGATQDTVVPVAALARYTPAATLTSSSSHVAWDLNLGRYAVHVATQNTTLDNPSNMVAGATCTLKFVQNASAAKTLAFGTAYKWPGGSVPAVSTGLGAVDIFTFVCDGTNMYGSVQKAFA